MLNVKTSCIPTLYQFNPDLAKRKQLWTVAVWFLKCTIPWGSPHIMGKDKIWAHLKAKIKKVDTQHALVLYRAGWSRKFAIHKVARYFQDRKGTGYLCRSSGTDLKVALCPPAAVSPPSPPKLPITTGFGSLLTWRFPHSTKRDNGFNRTDTAVKAGFLREIGGFSIQHLSDISSFFLVMFHHLRCPAILV